MDLIALLKELTSTGISDFVFVGVTLVVVRYWFSETRREISKEIDDKVGSAKTDLEALIRENRQEIAAIRADSRQDFDAARAYSEQAHQETRQEMRDVMLHLIDVRERLANIEGRLGAPTPRMSGVSPPLDTPAEEPSAQS